MASVMEALDGEISLSALISFCEAVHNPDAPEVHDSNSHFSPENLSAAQESPPSIRFMRMGRILRISPASPDINSGPNAMIFILLSVKFLLLYYIGLNHFVNIACFLTFV